MCVCVVLNPAAQRSLKSLLCCANSRHEGNRSDRLTGGCVEKLLGMIHMFGVIRVKTHHNASVHADTCCMHIFCVSTHTRLKAKHTPPIVCVCRPPPAYRRAHVHTHSHARSPCMPAVSMTLRRRDASGERREDTVSRCETFGCQWRLQLLAVGSGSLEERLLPAE